MNTHISILHKSSSVIVVFVFKASANATVPEYPKVSSVQKDLITFPFWLFDSFEIPFIPSLFSPILLLCSNAAIAFLPPSVLKTLKLHQCEIVSPLHAFDY